MMKMVSMAMKAEGKGKSEGCCCCAPCECDSDKPRYPWGLQLHLEGDQLAALGMTDLPKVGSVMVIQCSVKVTGCREEEREGGESERTVSMQITEIGAEAPAMSDKEKAGALYSKSEGMGA